MPFKIICLHKLNFLVSLFGLIVLRLCLVMSYVLQK